MSTKLAVVLSWSGGKDSALALDALRADARVDVRALLTTITDGYDRVSVHGVRRTLLEHQARVAGLPLVVVRIPPRCPNDVYEERLLATLTAPGLAGIEHVAFGDLFLEDIRAYREHLLARVGWRALFPLWALDTAQLARRFIEHRFQAVLVCVDPARLDPSFAGRAYDTALLEDLPADVDPCGENGEFHTFVHAAPVFSEPVACEPGKRVRRDGFVFCDVVEA